PAMSGDGGRYRDLGLLCLRVGMGAMFVTHGLPKMLGGPSKWHALGTATSELGIHVLPTFFGFMAACAELGGGVLLAAGIFFRPACTLMAITMLVATTKHLSQGDSFAVASHAIEAGIVFLSLLLIGPGRWRIRVGK
ncbi:MAG: DoxX family protein, partial [Polyangiales bacterium]